MLVFTNLATALKSGTGSEVPPVNSVDADRFWSKVVVGDGCWEWQAGKVSYGYGVFKMCGKQFKATRISFRMSNPDIPLRGRWILHSCDNPPCVNPDHLFIGDAATNVKDREAKGRGIRGVRCHTAKIAPEDVARIRRMGRGANAEYLAPLLGLTPGHVRKIIGGRAWSC